MGDGIPGVPPPTDVQAGRGDNVATITPDIEAREEADLIRDRLARVGEEEMSATPTCQAHDRFRKVLWMRLDELLEALLATVVGIDIERYDARNSASRHANVGVRPLGPPLLDSGFICGGVFDPVGRVRMFAWTVAGSVAAGALAVHYCVNRDNGPATLRIAPCCNAHVWVRLLVVAV